ncbi:concanavalin A-like lectin/glucanase domain-containing protein [Neurospora hispaniola]|uniref:Concanavalin A-like lectin/glucanase domain-containing protein n=1 Tax=Neurospora hispaniola TaxID=588809 RepID=A0AAJ0I9T8_9PEZI|nr:concanavalin A-like lectin/glucanase domain-containing protein [Neurospora hispaniola]
MMLLTSALSALWLATAAHGAVQQDAEGNVKSIGVSSGSSASRHSAHGTNAFFQQLRTHSLNQPYLDSDTQSRWYDFGGDTIIRTDQYIRLTSDRPSQMGNLWSKVPLTATNWEIEVEFKISGKNQLYGDGFAMWLTKERGREGPVFGNQDKFEGLGIFFDTYKNNRPGVVFPYVMAMVGDGRTSYDKDTDGKNQELAGCSARGIRHANVPTKFKLSHFQDKYLKLELQYKNEGEWLLCFETNQPPTIPPVAYLGFTAETGELSDNHDIISINARNLYTTAPPTKSTPGSGKGKKVTDQQAEGSWTWFLVKTLFFFFAVGGAYVGYTAYRTKQQRSHRF